MPIVPERNAAQIHELLMRGGVLIHCEHGIDRTGAAVGYHLGLVGWTMEDIIEHNEWEGYLERKGEDYRCYWDVGLMTVGKSGL